MKCPCCGSEDLYQTGSVDAWRALQKGSDTIRLLAVETELQNYQANGRDPYYCSKCGSHLSEQDLLNG